MSDNKTKDEWKERELGALWRVDGNNQSFYSGEIADKDGSKRRLSASRISLRKKAPTSPISAFMRAGNLMRLSDDR